MKNTQPEVFSFELPPTMNEIIRVARSNKYASAKLKKHWTAQAAAEATGKRRFKGKVWMTWLWHIKNLSRDEDNLASARKFLCDGLVGAGVIKNDNCRIIMTPVIHWHFPASEDSVEAWIDDSPHFLYELMEQNREAVFSQQESA